MENDRSWILKFDEIKWELRGTKARGTDQQLQHLPALKVDQASAVMQLNCVLWPGGLIA
jgi:hypothetical protein